MTSALALLFVAKMGGATSIKVKIFAFAVGSAVCVVTRVIALVVVVHRAAGILDSLVIRTWIGSRASGAAITRSGKMSRGKVEAEGETVASGQLFSGCPLTVEQDELGRTLTVVEAVVGQSGWQRGKAKGRARVADALFNEVRCPLLLLR